MEILRSVEENKSIEPGRSRPTVSSASPSRISTKSDKPPAARFWPARTIFDGSNSLPMRRPPPLSLRPASFSLRSTTGLPKGSTRSI